MPAMITYSTVARTLDHRCKKCLQYLPTILANAFALGHRLLGVITFLEFMENRKCQEIRLGSWKSRGKSPKSGKVRKFVQSGKFD